MEFMESDDKFKMTPIDAPDLFKHIQEYETII